MRKTTLIVFLLVFASVSTAGYSLRKNERVGFIFGIGIGASILSWNQTYYTEPSKTASISEGVIPVCTDIRIGAGFPGNRFTLYYWNKFNWFRVKEVNGIESSALNGIHALGASYYLKPSAPSLYVNGGIGLSSWQNWFFGESAYGIGFEAGIGYEFTRHWSMDFCFMSTNMEQSQLVGTATTNTFAISFCLLGIAY